MIKIDPNNIESLKEFFRIFEGATVPELAQIAKTNTPQMRKWRAKCGLNKKDIHTSKRVPKKITKYPKVPRERLRDREWLYENYIVKGKSPREIAYQTDTTPGYVRIMLSKKRIKKKKNPCRSEEWLYYHYATKKEYLEWCQKSDKEPDENGGMRMGIFECAELAGVYPYTIIEWLVKFNLKMRSAPAQKKGVKMPGLKQKRQSRDRYFENYRKGIYTILMSDGLFSRGARVGSRKI